MRPPLCHPLCGLLWPVEPAGDRRSSEAVIPNRDLPRWDAPLIVLVMIGALEAGTIRMQATLTARGETDGSAGFLQRGRHMHIVGALAEGDEDGRKVPVVARGEVTIAVVDDHELVSQLLVGVLTSAGFKAYAGYTESVDDIVADLAARETDVVLLDYYLGEQTADDYIGPIMDTGATVVMLTAADDLVTIATCVEAGAVGYLSKGVSPDDLVRSIELVITGGEMLSEDDRFELNAALRQAESRAAADLAPFTRLTDREQQTLMAICDGRSAAQMAEMWDLSVATVRSHIRAVLVKLEASSQLEAAAMARRVGWPDVLRRMDG